MNILFFKSDINKIIYNESVNKYSKKLICINFLTDMFLNLLNLIAKSKIRKIRLKGGFILNLKIYTLQDSILFDTN